MIAVLLAGLTLRVGVRQALPAVVVVGVAAITLMAAQWSWFGSVMGAKLRLQADGLAMHGVSGTLSAEPWIGAAGLLISPSRGLIAFSPIVLIPILALPAVWRLESATGERWWVAAAVVQYACYACYAMWWGGHTYGPRYLVDVLILLAPAATVGTAWMTARPRWKLAAMVALAWSVAVAAIGAFAYPHEQWNTRPADVDRHHQRLWEWRDPQILRCWQAGPSPQNFSLFDRSLIRARPAR